MKNTKFEALKYLKSRNYSEHFTKTQIDTIASDLVSFARQVNKNDCIAFELSTICTFKSE